MSVILKGYPLNIKLSKHAVGVIHYAILNLGMTSEMHIISGSSFRRIVSFIISEKQIISVARHSFPRGSGAFSRFQFFCFLPAHFPNALPTASLDGASAAVSILLRSIETARLPNECHNHFKMRGSFR